MILLSPASFGLLLDEGARISPSQQPGQREERMAFQHRLAVGMVWRNDRDRDRHR